MPQYFPVLLYVYNICLYLLTYFFNKRISEQSIILLFPLHGLMPDEKRIVFNNCIFVLASIKNPIIPFDIERNEFLVPIFFKFLIQFLYITAYNLFSILEI